jgi:hypothetical protein
MFYCLFFCPSLLKEKINIQNDSKQNTHIDNFKINWIKSFFINMNKFIDTNTISELMICNGRDCAKRNTLQIVDRCEGDINRLILTLDSIPDIEIIKKGNNHYHIIYQRCFCELISNKKALLPYHYCECSKGWLLELFERVSQKAVHVNIIDTIGRGDDQCKFSIEIE